VLTSVLCPGPVFATGRPCRAMHHVGSQPFERGVHASKSKHSEHLCRHQLVSGLGVVVTLAEGKQGHRVALGLKDGMDMLLRQITNDSAFIPRIKSHTQGLCLPSGVCGPSGKHSGGTGQPQLREIQCRPCRHQDKGHVQAIGGLAAERHEQETRQGGRQDITHERPNRAGKRPLMRPGIEIEAVQQDQHTANNGCPEDEVCQRGELCTQYGLFSHSHNVSPPQSP
jgi:hypothetical protein